jgi:hypothetical protein
LFGVEAARSEKGNCSESKQLGVKRVIFSLSFSWPGKGEEEKGSGLDKLGGIAIFNFFFQS